MYQKQIDLGESKSVYSKVNQFSFDIHLTKKSDSDCSIIPKTFRKCLQKVLNCKYIIVYLQFKIENICKPLKTLEISIVYTNF